MKRKSFPKPYQKEKQIEGLFPYKKNNSKSFFGKGLGKPIFTKNGFPIKNFNYIINRDKTFKL